MNQNVKTKAEKLLEENSWDFAATSTDLDLSKEHLERISKAIDNPSALTSVHLTEVVEILLPKSFERAILSYPVVKVLLKICEKDRSGLFMITILRCCRQWFTQRETKLRTLNGDESALQYKWSAFVNFIAEFYRLLKLDKKFHVSGDIYFKIADLLFDCCMKGLNYLDKVDDPDFEIDVVLACLRNIGRYVDDDRPDRMKDCLEKLRDIIIERNLKLSTETVKSILEIVEHAASEWNFSQDQFRYFYPIPSLTYKEIQGEDLN